MRSGGSSELVCKFAINGVYGRHLVVWVFDVVLWWFNGGRNDVVVLLFAELPLLFGAVSAAAWELVPGGLFVVLWRVEIWW
ncbi:hypothetical protein MTR67_051262 [Solanum verrucosum]|uniref:Transmembrane protein n=1 Tax=Solanum verrucosum TaxID=315347 RepID=A0AAF0V3Z8_SOLVR|nr:hypothetical protein MTR67_051262 [Solanum verrucosum]